MKFYYTLVLLLVLPALGYSQLVFQKTYGGPADDMFNDIKPTSDGGYILVGQTASFGQGNFDMYAVKTDAVGNITWNRAFGTPTRERAFGVVESVNGGYLLTGSYLVSGSYDETMALRLDAAGNQTWVNYYTGIYDEEGYRAIEAQGGLGWYICAITDSYGGANQVEYNVLGINNVNGGVITSSVYGGPGVDISRDIAPTSDGGFVVCGYTNSFGSGNTDFYIVKYSLLGTVQWTRTVGGPQLDEAYSIRQTSDGGYIVAGYTTSYGSGNEDILLVKLTSAGALSWARTLGGGNNDRCWAVRQSSDGGYIMAGQTNSFGFGNQDGYIVKVNSSGTYQWSKCYGGNQEDILYALEILQNGDLLAGGSTMSSGSGGRDGYLLKLGSNGDGGFTCPSINVATQSTSPTPGTSSGGTAKNGHSTANLGGVLITPPQPTPCRCAGYLGNITIQGPTLLCGNTGATTYSIPSLTNAINYTWSVNNATIASGQGTPTIVINPGTQNINLAVRATFGPCDNVLIDSIMITVDNIMIDISGDTNICVGETTQLNANITNGVNPINILWSTGQTNINSINVTPPGTQIYWVEATDFNGCTVRDSVPVTVYPYPVVNLGPDTVHCGNPQVTLNAGNPGGTYLWNTSATTQTINPVNSGIYWVDVTVNGCTTRDSVVLGFGVSPNVTVNGTTQICTGQNATINSNTNGGIPPYTYQWSTGQNNVTSVTISPPATQYVVVTVTDDNGCRDKDSLLLTVYPYPAVNLGQDSIYCDFPQVTLSAGNPGATYLWNTGANTQTIIPANSGIYWVDVTSNICTTRDSISLTFGASPNIVINGDNSLCIGESSTLQAAVSGGTSPYTYLWNTSGTQSSINVNPAVNTPYSVVVTDDNGCVDSANVLVSVYSYPVVSLGPDTILCNLPPYVVNAGNPGAIYQWSNGANTQTLNINNTGTYWVAVTVDGCTTRDTVRVKYDQYPSVNLGDDVEVCSNLSVLLDAGNEDSYFLWNTGATTQFINVFTSGTYWVTATKCGVTDADTIIVRDYSSDKIFIPNTFTPNDDGLNETFFPVVAGENRPDMQLEIFDRWGQLIFRSKSDKLPWLGTVNADETKCPPGTYVYKFTIYDDCMGTTVNKMGLVNLIR